MDRYADWIFTTGVLLTAVGIYLLWGIGWTCLVGGMTLMIMAMAYVVAGTRRK